jgi:serine protease Do
MNQTVQPPEFKKKSSAGKWVIGVLCCGLAAGVFGYGGATLAIKNTDTSASSKVTINQSSSAINGSTTAVDVSDVVAVTAPTVVEITTESVSSGNSIFGQYVSQGAGSGVIMSSDGYIITNNHVVDGATSIKVRTTEGTEYDATVVGTDSQTDLAVLKVDAQDLPAATFGNSNDLQVGDAAIAIGNPLGSLGGTVTVGIISALDRQIQVDGETMTLLQTDAAINPGNSGGGLFDANGNLIGIVNAKQSATGIEGLGFAIPISDAVDVLQELIENGAVTNRPKLNVSLQDVTSSYSNLEPGVYIAQITEGGAADAAGLKVYDRIVTFDGTEVTSVSQLKSLLRHKKIGDVVDVTVERDGQMETVEVTLQGE